VTTAFLTSDKWEEGKSGFVPDERTYNRRCEALANYWTKSLSNAFSSPVCIFYKTTDTSRPGTFILEVALTEARFEPAASAIVPDSVPAGNISTLLTGLPVCAFEARVTDAATGRVVSTVFDRRRPVIKVMDSGKKTSAAPNEQICDEGSQQLMEASNIELFPKVRRNWFSLF
jgi:hypothetical protein